MKKHNILAGLIVAVLIAIMGLIGGYKYYSYSHPFIIETDTVLVYDTVFHEIPVDVHHYTQIIDTVYVPEFIEIPADIDTAAILVDYYSTYRYDRSWSDSMVIINFSDYISRNQIISSTLLNYKLLAPQTIISNITTIKNYSSYLNISASSDLGIQYPEFSINFISKKWTVGAGYLPLQETFSFKLGYNLLKF